MPLQLKKLNETQYAVNSIELVRGILVAGVLIIFAFGVHREPSLPYWARLGLAAFFLIAAYIPLAWRDRTLFDMQSKQYWRSRGLWPFAKTVQGDFKEFDRIQRYLATRLTSIEKYYWTYLMFKNGRAKIVLGRYLFKGASQEGTADAAALFDLPYSID